MRKRQDWIEAWANAVIGLGISAVLVQALRWAGWWDAPALLLSAAFFAASVGRGIVLRRAFRWWETR